jgi:hypothetical protein
LEIEDPPLSGGLKAQNGKRENKDYGLGGKIKKLRAECNGLESLDAGML